MVTDRLRCSLSVTKLSFEEKKLFGDICFLVNEKMCLGVETTRKSGDDHLHELHVQANEGSFICLLRGFENETDLAFWAGKALEFNRNEAEASKKRR